MKTKRLLFQVCALALAASTLGCTGKQGVEAARQQPVAPVTVATVIGRDVPLQLQAIGNVEAISTVSIKAQISGELVGVHFKEGDFVKKGQLLFTIDRAPFEAALRQAEGTLARDEAQALNAKIDAERYEGLGREGVVSRQQVEAARSAATALAAASTADRAAVETAKINLKYTTIYCAINGRTGTVAVKLGNLVKANDVPILVTINQIEPIYVSFAIPEQQLADLKQYSAARTLKVKASPQGSKQQFEGKLTFIDNTVDLTTGTIKLKATFDNQQHLLWPGQFADVSLTLATQANAMVIPTAALLTGQNGTYVYVVDQDLTVKPQPVKVARSMGDEVVIASGLQAGQRVVTDGQLQVIPGGKVNIKNAP
ncbi:MAG TPA: efflux RND transporter periplasmic adaptor subunit [Verrucomicrobiae bacterium]|jgi:multidrug efflux system membrane fusion protein|nr:efflux RND transporter periplasmic adaptor subunit [Verrucomicrobiae bacterium]